MDSNTLFSYFNTFCSTLTPTLFNSEKSIHYFAKFNLRPGAFRTVQQKVTKLKEKMFNALANSMKYSVHTFLQFPANTSENEAILSLFSVCFLHFYSNFDYDTPFSFEQYFTQGIVTLCSSYEISILDMKQFQIFCFSFYTCLKKGIEAMDYAEIQDLLQREDLSEAVPLTSTTEKRVEMDVKTEDTVLLSSETECQTAGSTYRKRIFTELTKSESDSEISKLAENLSSTVYSKMKQGSKVLNCNGILFYLVEVPVEKASNPTEIRFAITAADLYYKAVEVYFSLYDMHKIDLNVFLRVADQKLTSSNSIQFSSIKQGVSSLFRLLSNQIVEGIKSTVIF